MRCWKKDLYCRTNFFHSLTALIRLFLLLQLVESIENDFLFIQVSCKRGPTDMIFDLIWIVVDKGGQRGAKELHTTQRCLQIPNSSSEQALIKLPLNIAYCWQSKSQSGLFTTDFSSRHARGQGCHLKMFLADADGSCSTGALPWHGNPDRVGLMSTIRAFTKRSTTSMQLPSRPWPSQVASHRHPTHDCNLHRKAPSTPQWFRRKSKVTNHLSWWGMSKELLNLFWFV